MIHSVKGRSARLRQRGGARLPALLALMLVFGAGVLAYQHFFQRPGEAAINLIPADALIVATLDTTPSPEQVPVFAGIRSALRNAHIDTRFDEQVTQLVAQSPIAAQLRPTLASSFAAAVLKGPSGRVSEGHGAVLAALKDPDAARVILAQHGAADASSGLTVYSVPNSTSRMAIIENYLVLVDQPEVFARILAVSRGEAPSVARAADFQAARAGLPADSNLMCFVAPAALREASGVMGPQGAGWAIPQCHWMAVGLAIHAHGIDTVFEAPITAAPGSGGADIGRIAPIDPQLLKRLPSGAFGLMAISQPGHYWSGIQSSAEQTDATRHGFDEGVGQFERETGMSIVRDVVPAFEGDLALAVYRDATGNRDSADGLIVLDDAQGADPAALMAKVRDYVARASGRNGGTPAHFFSEQRGNATIWSLDPDTQERMRGAVANVNVPGAGGPRTVMPATVFSTPPASAPPAPDVSRPSPPEGAPSAPPSAVFAAPSASAPGEPASASPAPQAPGDVQGSDNVQRDGGAQPNRSLQRAVAGKTLVWAEVGKAVLIASSRAMLDRALATFTTGAGSLSDDPTYAQMSRQAQPGAQALLMIDLPGIMEALRPPIARALGGRQELTANDLIDLFGHGSGIVCSQRYDGKTVYSTFSMPLDYGTLIRLFGAAQNAHGNSLPAQTRTPSPVF
jgi:hypothetical protein